MTTIATEPQTVYHETHFSLAQNILAGTTAGLLAGLLYQFLLSTIDMSPMLSPVPVPIDWPFNLAITALTGIVFCLTVGQLVSSPGSGMIWGVCFGLLIWLVGPVAVFPITRGMAPALTSDAAHDLFPLLIGLVVSYGATMGALYPIILRILTRSVPPLQILTGNIIRAGVAGSLAGLLGGLLFGRWIGQIDIFPLLAGFVGSASLDVGYGFHLVIAVVIGVIYGLLFRSEPQNLGPSIIRGVVYGFVWWIVGSLTAMPLLSGDTIQWSLEAAQATYGGLIGHIIYGIILAFAYAFISRLNAILFIESDPLQRQPESPGTRSLRAIITGGIASISGGLLFTIVLASTGNLPTIGMLGGSETALAGFVVHMFISVVIGATYGLFFSRAAKTYGAALIWGMAYGQVWWFVGALTLMPLLLTGEVTWSLDAAAANYPSLMGHLLYGGTMALTFHFLSRRYDPLMQNPAMVVQEVKDSNALWIAILLPGILVPLLLII